MDKAQARVTQIMHLRSYKGAARATATAALVTLLTRQPEWQAATTVATTFSDGFEFDTSGIIAAALAANKQVLLPRVMPQRQMAFLPYVPGKLVRSQFGIAEPTYDATAVNNQPDLVVVPGLAYSQASHRRLGFGGGYYDRFLAVYPGPTISLALPVQTYAQAFWDEDDFDIPVHKILTLN